MFVLLPLLIFLIILFLAIIFIFFLYLFDVFVPAPFVASKKEQVLKMIEVAKIKKGDKVLDLGSGDGRLVIEAAKAGAVACGVEKNPFLVIFSKIKVKLTKVEAKIVWGDIFTANLKNANIIFLYLNPKMLTKLALKLKKEAREGTKIVSNTYKIPNFKPVGVFENVFLYQIKLKKILK